MAEPSRPASRVAVLVVSHESREPLRRCLVSLRDHASETPFSVHVADNASTDGTREMLRGAFPDVPVLAFAENRGFARACNALAARSDAPWILLLNPDTEVRPGAIDALLAFAEARPEAGLYGGRTLRPDGAVDPGSCWGLPTPWSATCFALGLSTLFRGSRWLDPESPGRRGRDTEREVDAVSGCLLLVSRALWERLGGLDERYFVYGEDIDLARRAARLGHRPAVTPACRVVHAVGRSSPRPGARRVLVLRGKATYMRVHWGGFAAAYGRACLVAGTWLRGPAAGRVRRLLGRAPDASWDEAWRRRREWRRGWP